MGVYWTSKASYMSHMFVCPTHFTVHLTSNFIWTFVSYSWLEKCLKDIQYNVNLILIILPLHILKTPCAHFRRIPLQNLYAIQATCKACLNFYFTIPIWGDQYKSNTTIISGILNSLLTSTLLGLNISKKLCNIYIFHSKRDSYVTATKNDSIRKFSILGSKWVDKSY
jgi:hypothetical protein